MMEEMREDLPEPTDHCAYVVTHLGQDGRDEGGLDGAKRSLRIAQCACVMMTHLRHDGGDEGGLAGADRSRNAHKLSTTRLQEWEMLTNQDFGNCPTSLLVS